MNNYLFRGKSTGDLGIWIYGYYHYDKVLDQHFISDIHTLVRYEVRPETVGQATGWKCKTTGKDVFDGDWNYCEVNNAWDVVRYSQQAAAFVLFCYGPDETSHIVKDELDLLTINPFEALTAFEVHGNIWDDPIPGLNIKS